MYDTSSRWQSQGQATAAQIQAWLTSRNAACPAVGQAIYDEAMAAGLNADLVAAQFDEETGSGTSAIFLQKKNPAGIGAVDNNPMGGALTFPTYQAGIHAQCAHLLSYVVSPNPWKADDPRYSAMPAAWLGTRQTLGSFGNGVWATDPQYAANLVSRANSLLSSLPVQNGANMGRDPKAIWKGASNYNQGRAGYHVDHITDHMTAGTNSITWLTGTLQSSNTDSSAHYLVERDGTIYQYVDENDTPWSDGNLLYNQTAISIEHESLDGQGFTDAQINASIGLQARIAQRLGWKSVHHPTDAVLPEAGPAGTANLIGHSQVPDPNNASIGGGGSHHLGCPGPLYPWQRVVDGVNALLGGSVQPQVVTPPAPVPGQAGPADRIINGHKISGGFRSYYEWLETQLGAADALMLIGLPISDELQEDGLTVQYFERARFEWHPGQRPDRWDTLLSLLGSQVYAERHPAS